MNKVTPYIKKHPFFGAAVVLIGGVFICIEYGRRLLNSRGCGISVSDCYMTVGTFISAVATACMACIAYEGNKRGKENAKIAKASADAAQKQADAAIQSLQEAQKQRKEMYRPKLVVYTEEPLKPHESLHGYQIEIENIGNTPAYNIAIQIENTSMDGEKLFNEKIKLACLKHGDKKVLTGKDLLRNVDWEHYMSRSVSLKGSLQMTLNYNDWHQEPFSESIIIENPSY